MAIPIGEDPGAAVLEVMGALEVLVVVGDTNPVSGINEVKGSHPKSARQSTGQDGS